MQEQAENLSQAVAVFRLEQGVVQGERRTAARASNVERLPSKAAKAADKPRVVAANAPKAKKVAGAEDEWAEF